MKKFYYSIFIILIITAVALSQQTKPSIPSSPYLTLTNLLKTAVRFDDLFVKVRTIKLSVKDELIGEITRLDVSPNFNFLVYDRLGPTLFLLNKEGLLIRKIEVSKDVPGLSWRPQYARFTANGSILVTTTGSNHLFLFDSLGQYQMKIPDQFPFQYLDLLMNSEGFIYGYSLLPPEYYLKKLNSKGEILTKGGIFPDEYKNFFSRISATNNLLVLDYSNHIYQINACGPEVYKLSGDLKLIKIFDHHPPYYRKLKQDIPGIERNFTAVLAEATKMLNNCTQTISIHLLTRELIMLQYLDFGKGGGCYLDFCTLNGDYLTEKKIKSMDLLAAAFNSFVYKTFQPELQQDGILPNPVIMEYKLKDKSK